MRRMPILGEESGMTLIEALVAALMSVIIVGAGCAMLISAVRSQPALSKKSQNVTTARYQLERLVRELRNGIQVEPGGSSSQVTIRGRLRRTSCGGPVQTNPTSEPVECMVTYSCSDESCTRREATLGGTPVGITTVAASGLGDAEVFCFVPSSEEDPTRCGPPQEGEEAVPPTYVGVNLDVPNPEGPGLLTIADGATLRTAAFSN